MSRATPPLDRKFPNKDNAVEEGMPLLCSILFGFSGLYFAAVCVTKDADLTSRSFSSLPFLGTALGHVLDFRVQYAIMTLSALCCVCFYLCVMGALYAKMYDTSHFVEPAGLDDDVRRSNKTAINRAAKQRRRCISVSLLCFNAGIFLLPLSLLVYLPDIAMSITISLYLVLTVVLLVWKVLSRVGTLRRA
jgi:hypothetical protein